MNSLTKSENEIDLLHESTYLFKNEPPSSLEMQLDNSEQSMILSSKSNLLPECDYGTYDEISLSNALENSLPSNTSQKIKLYKIRWYLLIVFSLSGMMTSVYQMGFSSIQKEVLTFFEMEHSDTNKKKVNLFSLVYNFNVIFAYFASYLIKRLGLAPIVDVGMFLNFVGGWVRFGATFWRSENGFWVCFVGQIITSFAQSAISYSGTLFSSNWFAASERGISTTISSFSNLFGSGVAFSLNTMVGEGREWTLSITLLIQALVSTIVLVSGFPFFRSKPPTPANIASANTELNRISFFKDIWMLFTNINALILLVTYALGFGTICGFLSLISQIVTPKGYDGTIASIFGLLIIFSGGFGAVTFSILASKTKRFKLLMWISGIGALFSLSAFTFVIHYDRTVYYTAILIIFSSLLGFFALPFVPLVMELACEITYPVAANVSHVAFGSTGTGSTILFILILQELQSKDPKDNGSMQNAMYVIMGAFALALVVFIFFRGKYLRTIHETQLRDHPLKESQENNDEYFEYPEIASYSQQEQVR